MSYSDMIKRENKIEVLATIQGIREGFESIIEQINGYRTELDKIESWIKSLKL